jgi:glycosyltransferase involved in cell wall biosynthesis
MSLESRSLRVLMLSRDKNGLDATSQTATRWKKLTHLGVELEVWILSPEETSWQASGIRVFGTGGRTLLQRLFRASRRTPVVAPDLVTAQDPAEIGLVASCLAQRFLARYEVQDHGAWFDGSTSIDEPFWGFRFWLAKQLVKKADSIRSVSPLSVEWLKKQAQGTVYWLPIVPDPVFRTLVRHPISERIVCVARLVSVKQHALLLEAFALVLKERPGATLVLVGDGPERATLERRVHELRIGQAVEFVGTAPAASFISSADVFVLLSSHEGWGVASVEAALAGVPVVMSDTGCARWLAEQGAADVVVASDPQKIAQTIIAALGRTIPSLQGVLTADETAAEQVRHWKELLSL